ncbi:DNA polymerase II subunit B3-1-like isoform X1 [Phragmites australis]|uniref:DNA polymerase II subunit B3-1-like isoform X1 n=1 Tax=Phragmites australis TaxID=29695 RepID=UPI002D79B31F|nr:DNA polymerase II subunit B3-1-like isoform X1 [Phragmites australis]
MAGKKPAPPSPQRNGSAASSSKRRPTQPSEASTASAEARPASKPRKSSMEKPAASKQKRDKPDPQKGAKRKKQQASGEAGTPTTKRKKRDEPEPKPQKEAAPTKKQQSPGKAQKPATTPTKKQQKEAKREKQQTPGGAWKSTPTKMKHGDAEPQNEARSPKRAYGGGEARAPTPVKKLKNQKSAAADKGACSFAMARVRQLMRAEDATIRPSNEAVFLINKASELFLEKFVEDAYRNALRNRQKSIIYDNLSTAVCKQKGFEFLSDFVPQRVTAEDALKATALAQS